mmetsp:Transcript_12879/g.31058  ORF Transcript_12879/g.31058 Transcript_12879/m.31058 type:complete len:411 (-) Transcript_12879:1107-2339(-)
MLSPPPSFNPPASAAAALGLNPLGGLGHGVRGHGLSPRHEAVARLWGAPGAHLLLEGGLRNRQAPQDLVDDVVVERAGQVQRVGACVDGRLLALDEASGGAVLALQHLARLAVRLEVPVHRGAAQAVLHGGGGEEGGDGELVRGRHVVEHAAGGAHAGGAHHERGHHPRAPSVGRGGKGGVVEAVVLLLGELRHEARARVAAQDGARDGVGPQHRRHVLGAHAAVLVLLARHDGAVVQANRVREQQRDGHGGAGVHARQAPVIGLPAVHLDHLAQALVLHCVEEVAHVQVLALLPRRNQARVVHAVGDQRARVPRCVVRQLLQVHVGVERLVACVHLKNLQAPLRRGRLHRHLAVEAPGADERLVQHVHAVGGGNAHHARLRPEPVQLHRHPGPYSSPPPLHQLLNLSPP